MTLHCYTFICALHAIPMFNVGEQQLHESDDSVCTTAATELIGVSDGMTSSVDACRKTVIQVHDSTRKEDSQIEETTRGSDVSFKMEGDPENQSPIHANETVTNTLQAVNKNLLQTAEKVSVLILPTQYGMYGKIMAQLSLFCVR